MLGVCVLLACVGLSAGSIPVPKHRVGCYSYYDEAAKIKLSDTLDGYPRDQIQRELSVRPYMRPVLFDPDTIRLPHHPVQPVRRYKRSYAVDLFRKRNSFRPNPVHLVHPKPVHPIHPKPVPVHPIHPNPVHPIHPNPVHPIHPRPVHPIRPQPFHPNPVRPVIVKPLHPYKLAKPIGEACPTHKRQLRKFWLYGGDCYVVNPSYQKITYASCSKRDCSNCAYTKKHYYDPQPVNRCVPTYETEQVWAYCHKGGVYNQRIMRVSLSLPKYCSCKTFKC